MFSPGVEATFVPGDPGRAGWLALWTAGRAEGGSDVVELAVLAGGNVRRRPTTVQRVPVADALDALVALPLDADVRPSVQAWSVAARLAVELTARGRLQPSSSADGSDQWCLG